MLRRGARGGWPTRADPARSPASAPLERGFAAKQGAAMAATSVERLTEFRSTDLHDLCDAAEEGIRAGGGFGWLTPPPRAIMESYWRGVLLVPERQLFVGRLDGTIAGTAQLIRPPRNNEAQAASAQL